MIEPHERELQVKWKENIDMKESLYHSQDTCSHVEISREIVVFKQVNCLIGKFYCPAHFAGLCGLWFGSLAGSFKLEHRMLS